jgi:hypothetical protein
MPPFMSAIKAVLTAMAIWTGSCRGTTEVMMMTHLSRSSCVVRSFLARPFTSTLPADASAKQSSTSSARPVSLESADTCCVLNSIICISSPWLLLKPVRKT